MNRNSHIMALHFKIAQIRKRNVVSCVFPPRAKLVRRKPEHTMTTRKSILAAFAVLLTAINVHPVCAATSIVQEETTRLQADTIRYPAANTFMIEPRTAKRKEACSGGAGISTNTLGIDQNCHHLPTVHFQLGSFTPTADERQSFINELQRCGVSQTAPLRVTGYTCSLGTEQGNRILSVHRAWEVVTALWSHGYTVKGEDVQGRGEENPLTNERQIYAINRRVEISED